MARKKRGKILNISETIVPLESLKGKESHFEKTIYTIIIAFAIVCFWRGAWHLMDFYFFPNNPLLSSLVSLFLGIFILFFTKNLVKHLV